MKDTVFAPHIPLRVRDQSSPHLVEEALQRAQDRLSLTGNKGLGYFYTSLAILYFCYQTSSREG